MTVEEKIKKVLEKEKNRKKSLTKIDKFIEDAKKFGLIKDTEYLLPPLDTTGKNIYSSLNCITEPKS
jgi:hypothetical protein